MSDTNIEYKQSKLTRGDKCILIHVGVTLLVVLILVIIYVVHILMVTHEGWDALRVTRRKLDLTNNGITDLRLEIPKYSCVGAAYIKSSPARLVCNTILVRHEWSLAPAHCVTIRADPELSEFLPKWKLKYQDVYKVSETDVKRGIVHSFYNKDDFDNNIGLLEHFDHIKITEITFPNKPVGELFKGDTENLLIVGWKKVDEISSNPVRMLEQSRCSQFVTPIVDAPRKSEVCVVQIAYEPSIEGAHGGALFVNSQIVGFFSWGDRSGYVPQVILGIEPYKAWVENMIRMSA